MLGFSSIFRGHVHRSGKSDNPEFAISAALWIIELSIDLIKDAGDILLDTLAYLEKRYSNNNLQKKRHQRLKKPIVQ